MLNIVLFRPEIAGNTGNIIRLCANTGAQLHLIKPLGFELEDSKLRRAGLDYHEWASVQVHDSWTACLNHVQPTRIFAFSARATQNAYQIHYQASDLLLFGCESTGLTPEISQELGLSAEQFVKLPMKAGRSLNLSNAVAVTVYEAWRQMAFNGAEG
ncbi:tRNA (cytidine(34)-2'-O)-methyltransferase [Agitococcus lubricus]|uniref:tRNA (cytidine(34)-2'-O)-methyltransferase n=1 Tax=Agitococcus lubricus TaxID=1077255 RepID=A0A2T5IZA0_9GAMM|nr:tRNA (cytidine(34)-2'-O)-methyltransferase [Agitococcus lubricus]PTQ89332.1 tRNA (cytidine/uridine-2'-O-)-methyltransferase [Agitococcus lubricus]